MFEDPFEPYSEIVAHAKEEREQLDRMLTITTSRERLLIVACGISLLALVGWLFLGSVARSVALDGVLITTAGETSAASRTVAALVRLEPDIAPQLEPGTTVAVDLSGANGDASRIVGEIASLVAVANAGGAPRRGIAGAAATHRLEISLGEDIDGFALNGSECKIVVNLGEYSPASLLGLGRS